MIDKPSYFLGYAKYALALQKMRSAEINARFLLPYLSPDMTLLDCGCGLGSITIGFAKAITRGRIFGVDTEDSLLKMAKQEVDARDIKNIHFQIGNILRLPFPDNTFDVVYEHALLSSLRDYHSIALKEMIRVAKPGGIIACRETDVDTMIVYPESPIIAEARQVRAKMYYDGGVDFRLARKLRHLFLKAGIMDSFFSASNTVVAKDDYIQMASNYLASEMGDSIFVKKIIDNRIASSERILEYQNAWHAFKDMPGAFLQYTWIEALGYKS
jgi:ubiquinone/menaquinone biosynthesis C-methylase UbiE